jgi:hypothetical protein
LWPVSILWPKLKEAVKVIQPLNNSNYLTILKLKGSSPLLPRAAIYLASVSV